jgi:hypothetical protein
MTDMPSDRLAERLARRLDEPDCPHLAVFLPSVAALPPVLKCFYALGEARNGWLLHASRPGHIEGERRQLADAGLDVARLEAERRLTLYEFDLSVDPDDWADGWSQTLDARLAAGFDAVWYARFPIPPTDADVEALLPFEEAWMRRSRDRPVTLCPYIASEAAASAAYGHFERLSASHDDVLQSEGD